MKQAIGRIRAAQGIIARQILEVRNPDSADLG
jgi:hypothetical protein